MRIQLFTLMRIWIQLPETVWIHADPDQDPHPWVTVSLLQQPQIHKFKYNDDIHLCLLVLISPWWTGGARSEATHSPQLLMHKEKAGEWREMYFLLGFQGFPPFGIVTKSKQNYRHVNNDHNKSIYTFSYDPRFIDFLK
jgi:hypothetical protein